MPGTDGGARIRSVRAAAYTIPTERPESDGTLEWDATTIVVAEVDAGEETGLGYAYTAAAAARLIGDLLADVLMGRAAMDVEACWDAMRSAVRNVGSRGIASSAYSALDVALWDLKARLLGTSVVGLMGRRRARVPVYGSGGFTSATDDELRDQLGGWVRDGIRRVKMKVGRDPAADPARVREARAAIGPEADLFVDANGAYDRHQAVAMAHRFADHDVTWFEEPVSSDDRDGLRFVRDRAPHGMAITAGEYGWSLFHFRDLLRDRCVDVIQPDATRVGGFTGFLRAAELCDVWHTPISSHTAPQLHAHVCSAAPRVRHLELFHDHHRIESMLFDGAIAVEDGCMGPDPDRPGMGLVFRTADAEHYRV